MEQILGWGLCIIVAVGWLSLIKTTALESGIWAAIAVAIAMIIVF